MGDRDEVERLLLALPRQQRAALVLRYYLDWPDGEIAEALGCDPATVRSHLSHALVTLRGIAATPSADTVATNRSGARSGPTGHASSIPMAVTPPSAQEGERG